jgi:hypothetical protein
MGRAVRELKPRVIITADRFDEESHTWKDVMKEVADLPHPPQVIVTSRFASEPLWAETLNLGAFDLLESPYRKKEVTHCVSCAEREWEREHEFAAR